MGSWIHCRSVAWVAAGVGVTRIAVYQWISGRHLPDPRRARALVRLSHGALSYDDIYAQRDVLAMGRADHGQNAHIA